MKQIHILLSFVLFISTTANAQRMCAFTLQAEAWARKHPGYLNEMDSSRRQMEQAAVALWSNTPLAGKQTDVSAIPVIFHIVLDSAKFSQIGGEAGVVQRCYAQIATLNMDFNRENPDSTLIPSGWKPLYKGTGVRFGLAHTDPRGMSTPGYDIRITNQSFTLDSNNEYSTVKDSAHGGITTWDPDKYLNVWCLSFADRAGLLGSTTPYSRTSGAVGSLPAYYRGICVRYNAFGQRTSRLDNFAGGGVFDKGRTLTHELGHYFGLYHTWGDDGGACPWDGGADDGISDTSPESNATSGNPIFSIPGGTLYDGCKNEGATVRQPFGIPCINFMDYTNDTAMHMFTQGQVTVMTARVLHPSGESYSLTQHPDLLNYPTGIPKLPERVKLQIFPNPNYGILNITYDDTADQLQTVTIVNTLGVTVYKINNDSHSTKLVANLVGLTTGIYVVNCNFASGQIVRKFFLQ